MTTPTQMVRVLESLHVAAAPDLRAWMSTRDAQLRDVLRTALAPVTVAETSKRVVTAAVPYSGVVTVDYPTAVRAALRWANQLVSQTVFTPDGYMAEDAWGASAATYSAFQSFIGFSADEVTPEIAMAAIEDLRVHSHKQIPRAEWEAAYNAIRQAYTDAGHAPVPEGKHIPIFSREGSAKSGLTDGTQYSFKDSRVNIRLPFKRSGPRADDLLHGAGLVRNRDYDWYAAPGESYKSWIWVLPTKTLAAANALREHYPVLAAALTQNAAVWAPQSISAGESTATGTGSARATLAPDAGTTAGNVQYVRLKDGSVKVLMPGKSKPFKEAVNGQWSTTTLPDGHQEWWFVVRPERLPDLVDALRRDGRYASDVEDLTALLPAWTGKADTAPAPRPTVDVAQFSPVEGVSPEGVRWRWIQDKFDVMFWFPSNAKYMLEDAKIRVTIEPIDPKTGRRAARGASPVEFWTHILTTEIRGLPDAIRTPYPLTAQIFDSFLPTWTAERLEMRQSREQGETEEGGWTLLPNGNVKLWTVYRKAAIGWNKGTIGAIVRGHRDAAGNYYFTFKVKRVLMVVEALREHYPKLAEALNRTFGGIARTFAAEEDASACDPLLDMSAARSPADVKHPIGRAVVEDVIQALTVRLPHGLKPMPFQYVGIAFAKLRGYRALIGDSMGLGKTIQGLGCIAVDPEILLPAVVVCPASVIGNWGNEAKKWLPQVPIHVLSTGRTPLPPKGWTGIILVTWGLLVKHAEALAAWGVKTVIADEAHKAKEPTTGWSVALNNLAAAIDHTILLTGTPIKNRAIELWHLMSMIDSEAWGTREVFGQQFTYVEQFEKDGQVVTKYESGKNLDELNQKLRCYMIRRLKEQVLTDLPPKTRQYLDIELTDAQRVEYNEAADDFESWYAAELEKRMDAALRETGSSLAAAPPSVKSALQDRIERAMKAQALVKLGQLRQVVGRAKIEPALERIAEVLDAGEPIVVFAEHKEVIQGLTKGLKAMGARYGVIDGATPVDDRSTIVKRFQDGDIDVFIGTQAAKEGITLTRAWNTLFVERWWTPGDEEQAEDRIHRHGQRNAAIIWRFHAVDTIDAYMDQLIDSKREVIRGAVGDSEISTSRSADTSILSFIRSTGKATGAARKRKNSYTATNAPTETAADLPDNQITLSLMFNPTQWNPATARRWATTNGYTVLGDDVCAGHIRVNTGREQDFVKGTFTQKRINATITALVGRPK